MRPYLFDLVIAGHHIRPPSYGVLLAIGFSIGYFLSLAWATRLKEKHSHVENLFLLVIFGSVVGARLFHVLFEEFDYYLEHPLKIFAVWEGGYTFYGALLTSILFIYVYSRRNKLNYLQYGDIAGPPLMLGLFLGRVGCFLAGCCWGRRTDVPWAVVFSHPDTFCNVRGVPLHPTQLYEAIGCLILFIYIVWRFKHRQYVGQIFFHGLIGYGILRFIIEFFRGDEYRGYVFGGFLSYSQLVSLFILPFAIIGMKQIAKRSKFTG